MPSTVGRVVVAVQTNKSGGAVAYGDVVITDAANDSAFTTTTSSGLTSALVGVCIEPNGIANNSSGRIQYQGVCPQVNAAASVTRGNFVKTHTVAKQATGSASRTNGTFGVALTTSSTPIVLLFGLPDISASGNVAADTIWDAAGDLAVGTGADTATRLALGRSGYHPGSNGSTLAYLPPPLPQIVQAASNSASTTSLAVTIAAAASGQRLVVCIGSNARDVNAPTCTNVTFTKMGAGAAFSTTMYVNVYVGVVAGGSSGTSVTITATGSNFIEADVYEVSDPLTPTAGTSASLTNTSASTQAYVTLGPISPAFGTFWACVFGEDNGTTSLHIDGNALFRSYKPGAGTAMSAIGYAPGGPFGMWITAGTSGGDFAAYIVPIT